MGYEPGCVHTFSRPLERDVEFLHAVIDQGDLVVAHHHLHDICLYPPFGARHPAGPPDRVDSKCLNVVSRCWGF